MTTTIQDLGTCGQSAWIDYISRIIIENGELQEMIAQGLTGMTSNPTIFDAAIRESNIYDRQIDMLAFEGKTPHEIYDRVTIKDIQDSADIFRSVYERSDWLDGYVSLEINPYCADDSKNTMLMAKQLKTQVNRPNVMFKVPGTHEGDIAIEELTAAGVNVNVTLLFSPEQYRRAAQAYVNGIRRLIVNGGDPRPVRSVASIFVSRIDTEIDKRINEKINQGDTRLEPLKGEAAIANCMLCYDAFQSIFGADFDSLRCQGANIQRPLWGSTGTKNPAYSDIKYVTGLIAKDTVSTMPTNTFHAFLDHGIAEEALPGDKNKALSVFAMLDDAGINTGGIFTKLLDDGIIAFEHSFDSLIKTMDQKSRQVAVR